MNTSSIKRKLSVCRRCEFLCTDCPHALPCAVQGQQVKPVECYLCWHNQGTILPMDCRLRRQRTAMVSKGAQSLTRPHPGRS
jgi:hypothetical protein